MALAKQRLAERRAKIKNSKEETKGEVLKMIENERILCESQLNTAEEGTLFKNIYIYV